MDAEFTLKLIEEIKKRPIIYSQTHSDYRNEQKRIQAWKIIALELNEEVQVLKSKWKNLRDSYKKYKQAKSGTGSIASKKLYKWSWGEQMSFIDSPVDKQDGDENPTDPKEQHKPICLDRDDATDPVTSPTNKRDQKGVEQRQHSADIEKKDENFNQNTQRKRKHGKNTDRHSQRDQNKGVKKQDSQKDDENPTHNAKTKIIPNTARNLQRDDENENPEEKLDSVDLLFIGYAEAFKRLPRREQILLKFQIARIFMEAELSELDSPGTSGMCYPGLETPGNSGAEDVHDPFQSLDDMKDEMDP